MKQVLPAMSALRRILFLIPTACSCSAGPEAPANAADAPQSTIDARRGDPDAPAGTADARLPDARVAGDAGGSPTQLDPIPGQDPATVTAAGPPITVLTSQVIKLAFNETSALAVDSAGNIIAAQIETAVKTNLTKFDNQVNQLWSIPIANFQIGFGGASPNPLAVDHSGNIFVGGKQNLGVLALAKYAPDSTPAWTRTIGSSNAASGVFRDVPTPMTAYLEV